LVQGDDPVVVVVPPTTSSEADLEPGSLTIVGDPLLDLDSGSGGGESDEGEDGRNGQDRFDAEHVGRVSVSENESVGFKFVRWTE